jgi:hypothetical protein
VLRRASENALQKNHQPHPRSPGNEGPIPEVHRSIWDDIHLGDPLSLFVMFFPLVVGFRSSFVSARRGTSERVLPREDASRRGLAVCPGALGALFGALGDRLRRSPRPSFPSGAAVETLAGVNVVAFDKTGTLTSGELTLESLECLRGDEARCKLVAYTLSRLSEHPRFPGDSETGSPMAGQPGGGDAIRNPARPRVAG